MESGVYKKLHGRTGVGKYYQFVCVARHHTTSEEVVVYIPLRVELNWEYTVRFCYLERHLFEDKFAFIGEGLPSSDEIKKSLQQ